MKKERYGAVQGNTEAETRPELIAELDREIDPDPMLSELSELVKDSLDGAERLKDPLAGRWPEVRQDKQHDASNE